jgi:quercetin dioxygenase-like cupin family protein
MATHHASSGEVVDIRPLEPPLLDTQSTTVVHEAWLRVMRLVLPSGKSLAEHVVCGPLTLQCLEGAIEITAHDRFQSMQAGDFIYLAGNVPHAVRALEDASILVTVVLDGLPVKPNTQQ